MFFATSLSGVLFTVRLYWVLGWIGYVGSAFAFVCDGRPARCWSVAGLRRAAGPRAPDALCARRRHRLRTRSIRHAAPYTTLHTTCTLSHNTMVFVSSPPCGLGSNHVFSHKSPSIVVY